MSTLATARPLEPQPLITNGRSPPAFERVLGARAPDVAVAIAMALVIAALFSAGYSMVSDVAHGVALSRVEDVALPGVR
jgi:hypothetical protein